MLLMKKACEYKDNFGGFKYTVFNISAKDEGIEICQLHIYSNLEQQQNPTILFIFHSGTLIKFEFSKINTQNIQLMQAIVLVLSDVQGIQKEVKTYHLHNRLMKPLLQKETKNLEYY